MHVQKKKKKSGFLQLAVSSDWRKPAVNGYHPKKKKKKSCVNRLLCLFTFIHHVCIDSLVPSVGEISVGGPGVQVIYWGG